LSTERSFGLVFAAAFSGLGVYRWWHGHVDGYGWMVVAALFLTLALFWPAPLAPLNRLWGRVGQVLHAIVTPLTMGAIFFVAVMPTGLLLRLLGKDVLKLRRDPSVKSYWVACEGNGARPGAMKDQF
jgi:hypothetical protein